MRSQRCWTVSNASMQSRGPCRVMDIAKKFREDGEETLPSAGSAPQPVKSRSVRWSFLR